MAGGKRGERHRMDAHARRQTRGAPPCAARADETSAAATIVVNAAALGERRADMTTFIGVGCPEHE